MNTQDGDPTAHGGSGIHHLTVLYDANCPLCRAARRWLESRIQVVPLRFMAAGSDAARQRFPGLDHDATLRDLTVVADTGELYVGDGAWLACLWALDSYRELANRLAQPHLLPVARRVVAAAAAVRERTRATDSRGSLPIPNADAGYRGTDESTDCADDRCE